MAGEVSPADLLTKHGLSRERLGKVGASARVQVSRWHSRVGASSSQWHVGSDYGIAAAREIGGVAGNGEDPSTATFRVVDTAAGTAATPTAVNPIK